MFRDCWDYICYKIQDTILKNGQKQENTGAEITPPKRKKRTVIGS